MKRTSLVLQVLAIVRLKTVPSSTKLVILFLLRCLQTTSPFIILTGWSFVMLASLFVKIRKNNDEVCCMLVERNLGCFLGTFCWVLRFPRTNKACHHPLAPIPLRQATQREMERPSCLGHTDRTENETLASRKLLRVRRRNRASSIQLFSPSVPRTKGDDGSSLLKWISERNSQDASGTRPFGQPLCIGPHVENGNGLDTPPTPPSPSPSKGKTPTPGRRAVRSKK